MTGKLNDKMILSDMLTSQKFIMSSYNTAIAECQSESLRRMLLDMYNDEQSAQKRVFDAMSNRGLYKPQIADMTAISETKSRFQGEERSTRM